MTKHRINITHYSLVRSKEVRLYTTYVYVDYTDPYVTAAEIRNFPASLLTALTAIELHDYVLSLRNKQDTQRTYKRNTETCSRNHCCRGKATIFTHSERVPVALVIQHAEGMSLLYYLWPVWRYHILPDYLINGTTF